MNPGKNRGSAVKTINAVGSLILYGALPKISGLQEGDIDFFVCEIVVVNNLLASYYFHGSGNLHNNNREHLCYWS